MLLNWRREFERWCKVNELVPRNTIFDQTKYFPEELKKYMKIFNETHHIEKLPPVTGAIDAVRELHRRGCTLVVCTSFSNHYSSTKLRENNLINVFGNIFADIYSVPLRESKRDFLQLHLSDNTFFVDDMHVNLIDALNIGYNSSNLIHMQELCNGTREELYKSYNWKTFRSNFL